MESNESKSKASSPAQAESISTSANRRAFMKTVVTGTVAAGLAATVGKAEAATVDICGGEVFLPDGPSQVTVVFNQEQPPDREMVHLAIDELLDLSGCQNCGFSGILGENVIRELRFETGHLGPERLQLVVVKDFGR